MKIRALLIIVLSLVTGSLFAQTQARLTTMHAVQGETQVAITLHILCDGQIQYTLSPDQMTITDNGEPVEEITISENPSAVARKQFSAAIVMDASGSMSGAGNAGAKSAGSAFVQYMDGSIDEATVIFFNTLINVQQQMTTIKALLDAAVQSLPAGGGTAVWDATYRGIEEVVARGVNAKKAVLVLSDGYDNSSAKTPAQIIALAQQHNIRVFTVGLGYNISSSELELIALLTGGQYFQTPTPGELQIIFTQIANFLGRGFDEHTVLFDSPDPDVASHTIAVSVEVCGEEVESQLQEKTLIVASAGDHTPVLHSPALQLGPNAPNPVSAGMTTVIPYELQGTTPRRVRLELYDLLGRRVRTLLDREVRPGSHQFTFTPERLAAGTYLYRMSDGRETVSRMLQLR